MQAKFLQHCSTLSRHHSTERRNARIGLPPTTTKIGLVCDDGRMRAATCRQHRLSRQAKGRCAKRGVPFLCRSAFPFAQEPVPRSGVQRGMAADSNNGGSRVGRRLRTQLLRGMSSSYSSVCTEPSATSSVLICGSAQSNIQVRPQIVTVRTGRKEAHSR